MARRKSFVERGENVQQFLDNILETAVDNHCRQLGAID
jgi:hypothetical protein